MEDLACGCSILMEVESKNFIHLDDERFKVMEAKIPWLGQETWSCGQTIIRGGFA
jgi:hypothetical protein